MHGGMKTYTGSPGAARHYVEADRGRADDYYLTEGTGVAQRFAVSAEGGVRRLASLNGDAYEAWVAGLDPDTGAPKGRLRNDDRAVRFVEVVVNGPKSWSLAAELHPDISAAYDAAQDRAAAQTIGWLAEHATTRVGPRGAQAQIPVREIEAVTVRHYTSRSGDPHRHLHLQINARVLAKGTWRGLHTVGVRDSLGAINGIGHAAVACDPQFRQALAAHGFSLDPQSGEIVQLAEFVGAFSARAAQIGRNIDRYEADWRAANPGLEPGPALRRGWDARAWADARPDKVVPRDGAELTERWVGELHALGYRGNHASARVDPLPVGELDRDQAVREVLSRLAARRSGWNAADIRGDVEQLVARRNVVTDAAVRSELAEDLTARTLAECVPLLDRTGVLEHIRALTSRHVLDVEADLAGRLAMRGAEPGHDLDPALLEKAQRLSGRDLDVGQTAAAAVLAGDRPLVVIEGAAGAGETTTLAATRDQLAAQGRRLIVVTPTLKAAKIARAEVGAHAGSAGWLAFQHGWRWTEHGTWTRLAIGESDPVTGHEYTGPDETAALRPRDLVIVDEAGMLDQDTARALLTVADEHQARVALLGDRHQLSAVGRGGVLDLAARWADPEACLTLDLVHRFTRNTQTETGTTVTVPDVEYANLTLAMRSGIDPGGVFDALLTRGQIHVHLTERERQAALADLAAAALAHGGASAIIADTREQVSELNDAIRERLVAAGQVDDGHTTNTGAGHRIGAGDRIVTRRNDRELDVANRDTWAVSTVSDAGELAVTHPEVGQRLLPPHYVREHVELAYATTAHGVQGDTVTTAHVVVGEHTGAASAYVGMTRGRQANTAHLVAADLDEAGEQWVATFARNRADLGPAHAAQLADREASRYAEPRPLAQVLIERYRAWAVEQDCLDRLGRDEPRRDLLRDVVPLIEQRDRELPPLRDASRQAREIARTCVQEARTAEAVLARDSNRRRDSMLCAWDAQRDTVRGLAQTVHNGTGRFGQHRGAVTHARQELSSWAEAWRPTVPDLPTDTRRLVDRLLWFENRPEVWDTLDRVARRHAENTHLDAVAALTPPSPRRRPPAPPRTPTATGSPTTTRR